MSAELVKVIVRCRPTNTIEHDRRSKVIVYYCFWENDNNQPI